MAVVVVAASGGDEEEEHFVLLNQTLMAFHTNFMANDVIYLFPYCMPSLVEG